MPPFIGPPPPWSPGGATSGRRPKPAVPSARPSGAVGPPLKPPGVGSSDRRLRLHTLFIFCAHSSLLAERRSWGRESTPDSEEASFPIRLPFPVASLLVLSGFPSACFFFFFCHDVYLTCADATPKVRILGHRGRARGGLGVAKAKDRSSLPVSLKKRKKETAWPHRRSIAHKAQ